MNREEYRKLKTDVIDHYSNGTNCCKCCGEKTFEVLCLDHIHNDGATDAAKFGTKLYKFYQEIIKENYPKRFQVLCLNCNRLKSIYHNYCPHHPEVNLSDVEGSIIKEIPEVIINPADNKIHYMKFRNGKVIDFYNIESFTDKEQYIYYFTWALKTIGAELSVINNFRKNMRG